jgi:hypothetical protein
MYWVDVDLQNIMEIPVYFEMNVSVNHKTNIVINTFLTVLISIMQLVVGASALSWFNIYIFVLFESQIILKSFGARKSKDKNRITNFGS